MSMSKRKKNMARRGSRTSIRTLIIGALSLSAAALAMSSVAPVAAAENETAPTTTSSVPGSAVKVHFLSLGIGKSSIIDLPRDAKDVLVADPKIANAVIRSPQRAYIIGAGIGQTNVVFFDSDGQQIAAYDIAIKRDLNGVRAALKQLLPTASIQAEGIGDSVMLTGSVTTPIEAQQAGDVAARLAGGAGEGV